MKLFPTLFFLGFLAFVSCDDGCKSFLSYSEHAIYDKCDNGATCYASCLNGFTGRSSRQCLNGQWGAPTGTCYQKSTTTCSAEDYGGASWSQTNAGSLAYGVCDDPNATGTPTRNCMADGTWSTALQTHCQYSQCPAVTEGHVNWPLWNVSPVPLAGQCSLGYTGSPSRVCTDQGWNEIQNPCVKSSQCPHDSYGRSYWPWTNPGNTQTGVCFPGWAGNPQRICNSDGTWSDLVQFPCTRIQCQPVIVGASVFPLTNSGVNAIGFCSNASPAQPRNICSIYGVWLGFSDPC